MSCASSLGLDDEKATSSILRSPLTRISLYAVVVVGRIKSGEPWARAPRLREGELGIPSVDHVLIVEWVGFHQ